MNASEPGRAHLDTERANEATAELDRLSTAEALARILAEDATVPRAVAGAAPEIVHAVELIAARLAAGGRLFYLGAGTSGRLGVLDAAECPPTFRTAPALVQGVIAGGEAALTRAVEGVEDSRSAAAEELERRGLGSGDVVFGIAAGGTTPYVHAGLAHARERGAATVFLACVPREQAGDEADVSIRVPTGPEVIAGSTRLKAGTATKLVLNAVSTLVMVRLGKVHGNLMVGLEAGANEKLRERGTGIVAELTGLARAEAAARLAAADGDVKVAVLAHLRALTPASARERLAAHGGHLRAALEAD